MTNSIASKCTDIFGLSAVCNPWDYNNRRLFLKDEKNPLFLFVKSQVSIVTDKAERIQLMAEVDERLRPVMAGTAKSQWVKVCIIHGQIWQEGRGGGELPSLKRNTLDSLPCCNFHFVVLLVFEV